MRNSHLFNKAMLVAFAISAASLSTACSFNLKPMTDIVPDESVVTNALAETVECYTDDYFKNEISAETVIDDLIDESENYGYDLKKCTLIRVVDGDTIVVDYDGEELKVRLIGVNTPESVAPWEYLDYKGTTNSEEGIKASDWVKDLLADHDEVYLQKDTSETDKYGRLLRYVWIEVPSDINDIEEIRTKMLNGILIDKGIGEITIYHPDVRYADEFDEIATEYYDELDGFDPGEE